MSLRNNPLLPERRMAYIVFAFVMSIMLMVSPVSGQEATPVPEPAGAIVLPILEDLPSAEPDLSAFPVTIENCGRELTFDAPPARVISLWQPPTEMLLAIGVAPEQFVALAGSYAPYPDLFAPIVDSIPAIGTAMAWPAREVLLAEQPDFVISEGLEGFGYDPAQGYATVAEIEAASAQVYANAFCTLAEPRPGTIDNVLNDIRNLGAIFGLSERAEALIAAMEAERTAVVEAVADEEPVTVAFYNGGEGPLFVLSTDVWADLIETAGGINVFEGVETFTVSVEEFAAADPDVILVGTFPGQEAEPLITFLQTTFSSLQAVQNGRLYPIPTIDTENSIRVTQGLRQMAQALHPQAGTVDEAAAIEIALTRYPSTTVVESKPGVAYGVQVWDIELSNGVSIEIDQANGAIVEISGAGEDWENPEYDND